MGNVLQELSSQQVEGPVGISEEKIRLLKMEVVIAMHDNDPIEKHLSILTSYQFASDREFLCAEPIN